MQKEVWKDIPNFEGIYQISNHGNLKSFKALSNGRILSLKNKRKDYFSVVLTSSNNKRSTRIHRLVAEAFIENPLQKSQVNHIDGDKQNNHVSNLEWVTPSENITHSVKNNPNHVAKMIEYNTMLRPKKIKQVSFCGKVLAVYNNSKEAMRQTGVCARNILQVASKTEYKPGKIRVQAGGFKWSFL